MLLNQWFLLQKNQEKPKKSFKYLCCIHGMYMICIKQQMHFHLD